jgi:hypothetical protein
MPNGQFDPATPLEPQHLRLYLEKKQTYWTARRSGLTDIDGFHNAKTALPTRWQLSTPRGKISGFPTSDWQRPPASHSTLSREHACGRLLLA